MPDYIDPSSNFVFYEMFCSFYNSFFSSTVEKLNISAIHKSMFLICSVILPVIFIYKFCKKENLIQPSAEIRKDDLILGKSSAAFIDRDNLFSYKTIIYLHIL